MLSPHMRRAAAALEAANGSHKIDRLAGAIDETDINATGLTVQAHFSRRARAERAGSRGDLARRRSR